MQTTSIDFHFKKPRCTRLVTEDKSFFMKTPKWFNDAKKNNRVMLSDFSKSLSVKITRNQLIPVVYLLVSSDGEIVYIGQTENIGSRSRFHQKDKAGKFCFVYTVETPHGVDPIVFESALIRKFKPRLNKITCPILTLNEITSLKLAGIEV